MSFKTMHFILYLYILKATKDRTLLNIKVFLLQYAGKPIIIINFPNNIYFFQLLHTFCQMGLDIPVQQSNIRCLMSSSKLQFRQFLSRFAFHLFTH